MAFFRALETARPAGARLFEDPYAVTFLRPSLRQVVRLARIPPLREGVCRLIDRLSPGARPAGIARTRLIDDALAEALGEGIEQVVILGVGFDCRAYRLSCLAGARVFEVDRPAMLAERERRLAGIGARALAAIVSVPIDFGRERLRDAMATAGFDAGRRTFFLLEGATNYLREDAVDGLLRYVGSTARESRLLFTYVHREVIEHPDAFETTRFLRRALRRFGEPWTFGLDPGELAKYLEQAGLELLGDEGSTEYRERYLGRRRGVLRGYEFYRAALARVA